MSTNDGLQKHKATITYNNKKHCFKTDHNTNLWSPKLDMRNFVKTKKVAVCIFDCPRAPRPTLFFHVRHQQVDALGARICATTRQRRQPAKFWVMFSCFTQSWQFHSWHFGWWLHTWPLSSIDRRHQRNTKQCRFFHARPPQVLQQSQQKSKTFLHDTCIMKNR